MIPRATEVIGMEPSEAAGNRYATGKYYVIESHTGLWRRLTRDATRTITGIEAATGDSEDLKLLSYAECLHFHNAATKAGYVLAKAPKPEAESEPAAAVVTVEDAGMRGVEFT